MLRNPPGSARVPGILIDRQQKYSKKGISVFLHAIDTVTAIRTRSDCLTGVRLLHVDR
jgi:hypothetical protein